MGNGTFIVTFKEATPDSEIKKVKDDLKSKGCTIEHEYSLIKGFSFKKSEVSAFDVSALSNHPEVENVEKDQIMKTQ